MLRGKEISAWCFRAVAAGSAAVTLAGGTPKVHQALGSPLSLGLSLSLSLSLCLFLPVLLGVTGV